MKSNNFIKAIGNTIRDFGKHAGNITALQLLMYSLIVKITLLIHQKLSLVLFMALHHKKYREAGKHLYIVYTMAKVGSSSVYTILGFRIPHHSLFHMHFLTEEGFVRREKFHKDSAITLQDRKLQQLIKSSPQRRLKIITLVREPVSRNISDLFENLPIYVPGKKTDAITLQELMFTYQNNGFEHVLNWFEKEFNQFLEFDIYRVAFNKKEGYQIYSTPAFDLLVIRLEDLNNCFSKALAEFTGIKFKKLVKANESHKKSSAALHAAFKKQFSMDGQELEKIYSSTYVRHFYTPDEINRFLSLFSGKNSSEV